MLEIPGRIAIDLDDIDDVIISEKLSRAIRGKCEFALVGSETDSNNEPESKLIIVNGDVQPHSHLPLLIANQGCVKTAEGGVSRVTMQTTHVCMKNYYA